MALLSQKLGGFLEATSQTKIAYLEITILIEQQIAGFEISMNDISRVHVQKASQNLINEILDVLVGKFLTGD